MILEKKTARTFRTFAFAGVLFALGAIGCLFGADATANPYFIIRVVDDQTGRGVPLVELETVHHVTQVTDSAGIVAFNEPGLMEREVYFNIRSHGYEYPKDLLGNRGLQLTPRAGASVIVKLNRRNVAERLYRVTGAGIYRDTVLAGLAAPIRQPLLNADVLGQDTVIVTPYRGKLYWFWGDTDRVSYPLGNFAASGATSELPGRGGLDPAIGIDLAYFAGPDGFAKAMCPDFGPGLQWIESVMTVPDETGTERLVARVSSQKGLVTPYAWHLAIFNDEKQIFESKTRWENPDDHDAAHPFRARVNGAEYLYLYPNFRVRAELRSLSEPGRYEALTCVGGDGKLRGAGTMIDRDSTGAPRYTWKQGGDRLHEGRRKELVATHRLQPAESWLHLHDYTTGTPFAAGRGSVYWNEFRQRWVMLASGAPGEIWFGEADTPTGPWGYARRVVVHEDYNFYNPTQHPFFDQEGGRAIFFEGTYTSSFSAAKSKTPRYDYNQIIYRLRLDDTRLNLPAAVYRVGTVAGARLMQREEIDSIAGWDRIEAVEFFAVPPGRAQNGLVPVYEDAMHRLTLDAKAAGRPPRFLALPAVPSFEHGIAGRWVWQITERGGDEFEFAVELSERDGMVQVTSPENQVGGQGTFNAGQLKLVVKIDDRAYALSAHMRDGALQGEWTRDDQKLAGTWTARWKDSAPQEFRSPAVVPLFEYTQGAEGRSVYSANPNFEAEGLVRRVDPICRVWRNPYSALTFDRTPVEAVK